MPARIHRVALLTTEGTIRNTIITTNAVARVEDLKGKRLGYSVPGAVTHVAALSLRQADGLGSCSAISPWSATATRSIRLKEGRVDGLFGQRA